MKKISSKAICFWSCLCIIILGCFLYQEFYHIPTSEFPYLKMDVQRESPGGDYLLSICLYSTHDFNRMEGDCANREPVEMYIVGYLKHEYSLTPEGIKVWHDKGKKIIYYDIYNGSPISAAWLDDSTVVINGISLKTNQRYDYRWDRD